MLKLSLTCAELGLSVAGRIDVDVGARVCGNGEARELRLIHAKRDGQACFAYVDELTGLDGSGATRGRPGDLFAFGGDPTREGGEGMGQLVVVYGDDNLFVEPLDRGLFPREYRRVGSIDDLAALVRLGEHVWRRGAQSVELAVVAA